MEQTDDYEEQHQALNQLEEDVASSFAEMEQEDGEETELREDDLLEQQRQVNDDANRVVTANSSAEEHTGSDSADVEVDQVQDSTAGLDFETERFQFEDEHGVLEFEAEALSDEQIGEEADPEQQQGTNNGTAGDLRAGEEQESTERTGDEEPAAAAGEQVHNLSEAVVSQVSTFLEFTGTSDRDVARRYLSSTGGDLEEAMDMFLSGIPPAEFMFVRGVHAQPSAANASPGAATQTTDTSSPFPNLDSEIDRMRVFLEQLRVNNDSTSSSETAREGADAAETSRPSSVQAGPVHPASSEAGPPTRENPSAANRGAASNFQYEDLTALLRAAETFSLARDGEGRSRAHVSDSSRGGAQNLSYTSQHFRDLTARILRLPTLRTNSIRISSLNELSSLGLNSHTTSNSSNLGYISMSIEDTLPDNEQDLIGFDDAARICILVETVKDHHDRIHELGNIILASNDLCRLLLDMSVENLLSAMLKRGVQEKNHKLCIRALQVVEALTSACLLGSSQARERCKLWFTPPRRSLQHLRFGVRNAKSALVEYFVENVLNTSDVRKLEHLWVTKKFDPSWREKESESEILSFALSKGCSIAFIKKLVDRVSGCRANVNPEKERVGKLELPLLLAAKATGVGEGTNVSDSDYEDGEEPDCDLSVDEKREIWSYRAVEILLDYGASLEGIGFSAENEAFLSTITASARALFLEELEGSRRSTRLENLKKKAEPLSPTLRDLFLSEVLPSLIESLVNVLIGTKNQNVLHRALEVLVVSIREVEISKKIVTDDLVKTLLSSQDKSFIQAFFQLLRIVFSITNQDLLSKGLLLEALCILLKREESGDNHFKERLSINLCRFGVMKELDACLAHLRGTMEPESLVHRERYDKLLSESNKLTSEVQSHLKAIDVDPGLVTGLNSAIETVHRLLTQGKVEGLHGLAALLEEGEEDIFAIDLCDGAGDQRRLLKGLTTFEFENAGLLGALQNYFLHCQGETDLFFTIFPPPMMRALNPKGETEGKVEHSGLEELPDNEASRIEDTGSQGLDTNFTSSQILSGEGASEAAEDQPTSVIEHSQMEEQHLDSLNSADGTPETGRDEVQDRLLRTQEAFHSQNLENNLLHKLLELVQSVLTMQIPDFFMILEHRDQEHGERTKVRSLIKPVSLRLTNASKKAYGRNEMQINVLPITPAKELELQVLRSLSNFEHDPRYLQYCYDLLGHRIQFKKKELRSVVLLEEDFPDTEHSSVEHSGSKVRIRSPNLATPVQASVDQENEGSYESGVVVNYDPVTNAHLVKTIVSNKYSASRWLVLVMYDYSVLEKLYNLDSESHRVATAGTLLNTGATDLAQFASAGEDAGARHSVNDVVAVWYQGVSAFDEQTLFVRGKEMGAEEESALPTSFDTIQFKSPGWRVARILSRELAEQQSVTADVVDPWVYTVEYLHPDAACDAIIRRGDVVRLNSALKERHPSIATDTAKVVAIQGNKLITDGFEKLVLSVSQVEKVSIQQDVAGPLLTERRVKSSRILRLSEVYLQDEKHIFSVYIKPVTFRDKYGSSTEKQADGLSGRNEPEVHKFKLYDRIEARYGGKFRWYKGWISRVNADNTYDVTYDDADTERHVNASFIASISRTARDNPVQKIEFRKLFPGAVGRTLFDVLRKQDDVLQSEYNFVTRGFSHQPAFYQAFANTMRDQKRGLFAQFQTYDQAMTLAKNLNALSTREVGSSLVVYVVMEAEKKPPRTVYDEILISFERQRKATLKCPNAELVEKLRKFVERNGYQPSSGSRVQVLAEFEDESVLKKEVRWVPATILTRDASDATADVISMKYACVLDDGTVLMGVRQQDIRPGKRMGTSVDLKSTERDDVGTRREIASPVRKLLGRQRRRASTGMSTDEILLGTLNSSRNLTNRFNDLAESTRNTTLSASLGPIHEVPAYTSPVPSDDSDHEEGEGSVYPLVGSEQSSDVGEQEEITAVNKPGPVELTRRFTAFGNSLSYKHIDVNTTVQRSVFGSEAEELFTASEDVAPPTSHQKSHLLVPPLLRVEFFAIHDTEKQGHSPLGVVSDLGGEMSMYQLLYSLFSFPQDTKKQKSQSSSSEARRVIHWKNDYQLGYRITYDFAPEGVSRVPEKGEKQMSYETSLQKVVDVSGKETRKLRSSESLEVSAGTEDVKSALFVLRFLYQHLIKVPEQNNAAFSQQSSPKLDTDFSVAYEKSLPWKNVFLSEQLCVQLEDPIAIGTRCYPLWMQTLSQTFSFLFRAKDREKLVKLTNLGVSRAVSSLQDSIPGYLAKKRRLAQVTLELSGLFSGASPDLLKYEQLQETCDHLDDEVKTIEKDYFIGKLNEDLVKVTRDRIISDAEDLLERHKCSRSKLVVQFSGENSSGDGVTIDFFTSLAAELQQRRENYRTPVFVDMEKMNAQMTSYHKVEQMMDRSAEQGIAEASEVSDIMTGASGLVLQPLLPLGDVHRQGGTAPAVGAGEQRNKAVLRRCRFLGRLMAKAFLDGYHIPLPIAMEFFRAIQLRHNSTGDDDERLLLPLHFADAIEGFQSDEQASRRHGVLLTILQFIREKKHSELEAYLQASNLSFVDFTQPQFVLAGSIDAEGSETGKSLGNQSSRSNPTLYSFADESKEKTAEEEYEETLRQPDKCLECLQLPLTEDGVLKDQLSINQYAINASEYGSTQQDIERNLTKCGASKVQLFKALQVSQQMRNDMLFKKLGERSLGEEEKFLRCTELIPGGSNVSVTSKNAEDFVQKLVQWWFRDGIRDQLDAILAGLQDVLRKEGVQALLSSFSPRELKKLLCGKEEICWKEDDDLLGLIVPMGGYTSTSPVIKMLVKTLRKMNTKERSLFLHFATSQPRLPRSGLPRIKVYPPVMEQTVGIAIGFAMPILTPEKEVEEFENSIHSKLIGLFEKGDVVKSTLGTGRAVVDTWDPKERKINFSLVETISGPFQAGQLITVLRDGMVCNSPANLGAELIVKGVLEVPSAVQQPPYLRPKATTCAKTIYLPDGYKDDDHLLQIFREAFEDARLGGIHD